VAAEGVERAAKAFVAAWGEIAAGEDPQVVSSFP